LSAHWPGANLPLQPTPERIAPTYTTAACRREYCAGY
jgi:hypothetical protein